MILRILFFLSFTANVFGALSLDEKIGQLFIAPAYPLDENALEEGQPANNREYIRHLIENYHIGGVLLKYYWDIEDQKKAIEHWQALSSRPLFIAQDCEWGVGMRLNEVISLPKNMALGAIQNHDWLYQVGREIGRQCRFCDINFALAPVADVNNNSLNPVIGLRSFGDDPREVAKKVQAVASGIESFGVIACAKHFPGHGDTETNSHISLPVLPHSYERLKQIELMPFKSVCQSGIRSIMVGHLVASVIDGLPATVSEKVIEGLLRDEIDFQGLVVTDDLLMKALQDITQVEVRALKAGNDLLLSSPNIPKAIQAIKNALENGVITEEDIDRKVQRILKAKQWLAVEPYTEDLHPPIENLNKSLYQEIITLVHGPLQIKESYRIISSRDIGILSSSLKCEDHGKKIIVIGSASEREVEFIDDESIVILLGSPYELLKLPQVPTLVAYDSSPFAQEAVAKVLNGELIPKGRLPVTQF